MQHHVDQLDLEVSALELIQSRHPGQLHFGWVGGCGRTRVPLLSLLDLSCQGERGRVPISAGLLPIADFSIWLN